MNGKKLVASGLTVLGVYQAMELGGMFLTWVLGNMWLTGAAVIVFGALAAQAIYKMID